MKNLLNTKERYCHGNSLKSNAEDMAANKARCASRGCESCKRDTNPILQIQYMNEHVPPKNNNLYDMNKIEKLVNLSNRLHQTYGTPAGSLQIQLDDGYTGQLYAIDWDYKNGTLVVEIDDNEFIYAYLNTKLKKESNGITSDVLLIVDIIKEIIDES